MMKKTFMLIIILFPVFLYSEEKNYEPKPGTTVYTLYINGMEIGTSKNEIKTGKNTYISINHTVMKIGSVKNETLQTTVETSDFKPIRLEETSTTVIGEIRQVKKTTVTFEGNTAKVEIGKMKKEVTLTPPFTLNGNYYFQKLRETGFKPGSTFTLNIYEPQIELEKTVPLTIRVIGYKEILVNGQKEKLLHISESIAQVHNVEIFIDQEGIARKVVVNVMNNTIVMMIRE